MPPRDRRREAQAYAASMVLNFDKAFHIDCISKGVKVPELEPDSEGYVTVGRYCSGMNSARVQATRTRNKHPELLVKAVKVEGKEWVAELRVKLKGQDSE